MASTSHAPATWPSYVRHAVRSYAERSLGGSLPMLADERRAERDVLAVVSG